MRDGNNVGKFWLLKLGFGIIRREEDILVDRIV